MAHLATQEISTSGTLVSTATGGASGDTFHNTGNEVVIAVNSAGSARTVTVSTPLSYEGLALADRTVSINAGSEKVIGPFPKSVYGTTVALSYSVPADVAVAIILARSSA